MAEFPLAGHSEAVSRVLSTILPPRAYAYLSAFLPGFYLEVTVCLANPEFAHGLTTRLNEAAGSNRYLKILVAVFLAYVLGNAFMLWTTLVYRILRQLFLARRLFWRRFCQWPLRPLLDHLIRANGWWGRRSSVRAIAPPVRAVADNLEFASEGVRRLWGHLVLTLFKTRYGIDLKDLLAARAGRALRRV